jgi:hypothetical protein
MGVGMTSTMAQGDEAVWRPEAAGGGEGLEMNGYEFDVRPSARFRWLLPARR